MPRPIQRPHQPHRRARGHRANNQHLHAPLTAREDILPPAPPPHHPRLRIPKHQQHERHQPHTNPQRLIYLADEEIRHQRNDAPEDIRDAERYGGDVWAVVWRGGDGEVVGQEEGFEGRWGVGEVVDDGGGAFGGEVVLLEMGADDLRCFRR
jgi:hypothetical protein